MTITENNRSTTSFVFILITALLNSAGIGLIIPVLPSLVVELTDKPLTLTSYSVGLLISLYWTGLFLCSALVGRLSDRFGRRPIMLATLLGTVLDYLVAATTTSMWLLCCARVVAGACGANMVIANAYITDITTSEKRAQRFGILGAVFSFGMIVGPIAGGVLGDISPRAPFWAGAGLTGLNLLYGFLVLPESLPSSKRRRFAADGTNPFTFAKRLRRFRLSSGLAASMILVQLAATAVQATLVLFIQSRFNWSSTQVGAFFAIAGVESVLVRGVLAHVVISHIGERRAIFIGLSVFAIGFFLFGFATYPWQMYATLVFFTSGNIAVPALQAAISRLVSASEQGELQGALGSLTAAVSIVGPVMGTWIFGFFSASHARVEIPGAAFFFCGFLSIASLIFAERAFRTCSAPRSIWR